LAIESGKWKFCRWRGAVDDDQLSKPQKQTVNALPTTGGNETSSREGKKHDDVDQRARDCIARGWAEVVIGCCADPRLSYACTVQLLKAMRKSKM